MDTRFKRRLVRKLLLWGTIIALTGGLSSAVVWLKILNQEASSLAITETNFYQQQYLDYYRKRSESSRLRLQQVLDNRAPGGGFILVEIYNNEQHKVAAFQLPGSRKIDRYFERQIGTNDLKYETHYKQGRIYIHLERALKNNLGLTIGYFEGLFQVPDQTTRDLVMAVIINVVQTIVVIALVVLLLYPVTMALSRDLITKSRDLLTANLDMIRVLGSAIAKRDSDTNAHNYRVTLYAIALAEKIGLSHPQIQSLIKGSFLHDVGKIGIRDHILLKPGKLDADEFNEMKQHVQYGVEILQSSHWLGDAQEIVHYHHEKYDGSGYPQGLKNTEIPIIARIFAIIDVFDALASRRPYKEPYPFEKCMEIILEAAGSHFDPTLVQSFSEISLPLYTELVQNEDEYVLRQRLDGSIHRYFPI
ncbi:MAG TPA: HD domain-containing protein [Gammaproteobacteria bacterium]|nr:HD domain-containing protein [Gammaproteobacteria bacterium]